MRIIIWDDINVEVKGLTSKTVFAYIGERSPIRNRRFIAVKLGGKEYDYSDCGINLSEIGGNVPSGFKMIREKTEIAEYDGHIMYVNHVDRKIAVYHNSGYLIKEYRYSELDQAVKFWSDISGVKLKVLGRILDESPITV